MSSWKKVIGLSDEPKLTGSVANRQSRYGTSLPFKEILKVKIKEVESLVQNKLSFSTPEKLLVLIVTSDQKNLYEGIRQHFLSVGFKSFYVSKDQLPEIGENTYLFISWDIINTEEEEECIDSMKQPDVNE